MSLRFLLAMGLLTFLLGCSRHQLVEGGLYYTSGENGGFSLLKILKLDGGGVHVRLYSNHFVAPPTKVDESTLYMAGMDRKPGEQLGMGHAPISKRSFAAWKAVFIQQSTVKEVELEGYKMWLEAKGGYFD
ncbi:MAG TPA: hypothetical protein VG897_14165 [Terriglobales bacterium]|nr:hypothetical protein [Terriglobales bacterium]